MSKMGGNLKNDNVLRAFEKLAQKDAKFHGAREQEKQTQEAIKNGYNIQNTEFQTQEDYGQQR